MNAEHIYLRSREERTTPPVGAIPCIIDEHIKINPHIVQDYSARLFEPSDDDLLLVVSSIAFADRVIRRRRGTGWTRRIKVSAPVFDLDKWQDPVISRMLEDTLYYLTGDHWTFSFRKGDAFRPRVQSSLDFSEVSDTVIPFSDGLDSFIQWRLLQQESKHLTPLRIQTATGALSKRRNNAIDASGDRRGLRLPIPISLSVGNHPEPTYRTRTLVFFAMAALAASKVGAERIVIGENGVGAIGSSILPYGDEWPHRTTHPGYTVRLIAFLNAVLETNLRIEHPNLLKTKGEMLETALTAGIEGWRATHSCVRGDRDGFSSVHCGVCSGCLLRRQSLNRLDLQDDEYYWNDLSQPVLGVNRSNSNRPVSDNDRDIAFHAAHSMEALARLGDGDDRAKEYIRAAADRLPHQKGGQAQKELQRLFCEHAKEWRAFKARFGGAGVLTSMLGD